MKFQNQFNSKPISQFCPITTPELGYFYDDQGERVFGVVGEFDDFAQIQRHKDSCDFSILKEYLIKINYQPKGMYGVRPEQFSDVNDVLAFKNNFNTTKEVEDNANITENSQNSETSVPPVENNLGGSENE